MRFGLLKFRITLIMVLITFLLSSDVNVSRNKIDVVDTVGKTLVIPKVLPTVEPTYTPRVVTPTTTVTPPITSTPTLTATPTVTATATEIPLPLYHRVVTGETLEEIANRYKVPVAYIAYKNNIENLNLIYAGQYLYIEEPPSDLNELLLQSGKLIVVRLSTQTLTAYKNGEEVAHFSISSGVADFPTVTGTFYIYAKYEKTRMTAYDYDLPNVPWTMYFYEGYSIHGTYWHHNFGTPMSHGCVNMATPDAEWLYAWAPYYTVVKVVE